MRACLILVSLLVAACMHGNEHVSLPETPDCFIDSGPCSKAAGDADITLDVAPRPVTAMHELRFTISSNRKIRASSLLMDLSMPGMYMGRNEVVLRAAEDGSFSGSGIFPFCPKGHSLWKAEIAIPGYGTVSYLFNVNK